MKPRSLSALLARCPVKCVPAGVGKHSPSSHLPEMGPYKRFIKFFKVILPTINKTVSCHLRRWKPRKQTMKQLCLHRFVADRFPSAVASKSSSHSLICCCAFSHQRQFRHSGNQFRFRHRALAAPLPAPAMATVLRKRSRPSTLFHFNGKNQQH